MAAAIHRDGVPVRHLKAILHVGMFVRYKCLHDDSGGDHGSRRVAQIIDYFPKEQLVRLHPFSSKGRAALEDITTQSIAVIVDIAFVFNKLESYMHGRRDVFIVTGEEVASFPCQGTDDFPLSASLSFMVWNEIERVRMLFRHMLTSSSQQQGQYAIKRSATYLSPDTFAYIRRQLTGLPGVSSCHQQKSYKRIDYEIESGAVAVSKRRTFDSEELVFKGRAGIDALTALFGSYAVVGLRRKRPNIAQASIPLRNNDMLHYLVEDDDRVCCRLNHCAIVNRCIVEVHYRPYIVKFDSDGYPTSCPSTSLTQVITRAADNEEHNPLNSAEEEDKNDETRNGPVDDLVGEEFISPRDNRVYKVVSNDVHFVFAAPVPSGSHDNDSGEPVLLRLSTEIVKGLVDDYLE